MKKQKESNANLQPENESYVDPEPIIILAEKELSLEGNLRKKSIKESNKKPTRRSSTNKVINQQPLTQETKKFLA